jgi:hypothetical protein
LLAFVVCNRATEQRRNNPEAFDYPVYMRLSVAVDYFGRQLIADRRDGVTTEHHPWERAALRLWDEAEDRAEQAGEAEKVGNHAKARCLFATAAEATSDGRVAAAIHDAVAADEIPHLTEPLPHRAHYPRCPAPRLNPAVHAVHTPARAALPGRLEVPT